MSHPTPPTLPCLCASFRRTARSLTQLYEEALRPVGLRSTQLTILQVLSRTGEISQGRLGAILAMDSTSLTRTLAIMKRHKWIKERRGSDKRERWLSLSKNGDALLRRANPVWEQVQAELRRKIGEQAWNGVLKLTNEVASMAGNKGEGS